MQPIERTPWMLSLLVLMLPPAGLGTAADVVYLAPEDPSRGPTKYAGEILDYTGRAIRLRTTAGVERSFPARRVLRIEGAWSAAHQAANQAFERDDYRLAVQQYLGANSQESRKWVRQKIMAQLVWSYRALGQFEPAGDLFLALVADDPTTPYFASIPLAWWQMDGLSRQKADGWLAQRNSSVAMLLGASHLTLTDRRQDAVEALRALATDDDPRIAGLAAAQLWRTYIHRAGPDQIAVWEARIEQMPETIRAGPYFVLGRALLTQQQWQAAALAFLRVPILHPSGRQLAAAGFIGAGRSLAGWGRNEEAARLYQEVIREYGSSRWTSEAQTRLDRLKEAMDGKRQPPSRSKARAD